MNITPDPQYLASLVNQQLSWKEALGELIDNAFDARATRVEIAFGNKVLTVRDDGDGASDIGSMLTLGHHRGTTHTKLGRYGVGLKDASVWLAAKLCISTNQSGVRNVCAVDWDALRNSQSWDIPDPKSEPTSEPSGTLLKFEGLRKGQPSHQALVDALGFTFMPALRSGKQIVVRRTSGVDVCKPYELPPLDNVVEDHFEVRGKGVKLRAGIVKAGAKNQHPGFIFIHAFRVIHESGLGANGYSTSQIMGIVELDRKWDLGKNKSHITDADHDALGEAIYSRCHEILELSSKRARNIELEMLTGKAQSLVSESLSEVIAKERRKHGKKKGTVQPVGSNIRRINVGMTQPGSNTLRQRAGAVTLDWNSYGDDRLGAVDLMARRITLNLDHPALHRMRQADNADGIASLALTMFCVQVYAQEEQSKFPCMRNHNEVIAALGPMLAGLKPQESNKAQSLAER